VVVRDRDREARVRVVRAKAWDAHERQVVAVPLEAVALVPGADLGDVAGVEQVRAADREAGAVGDERDAAGELLHHGDGILELLVAILRREAVVDPERVGDQRDVVERVAVLVEEQPKRRVVEHPDAERPSRLAAARRDGSGESLSGQ
jgi:hypothetical protein